MEGRVSRWITFLVQPPFFSPLRSLGLHNVSSFFSLNSQGRAGTLSPLPFYIMSLSLCLFVIFPAPSLSDNLFPLIKASLFHSSSPSLLIQPSVVVFLTFFDRDLRRESRHFYFPFYGLISNVDDVLLSLLKLAFSPTGVRFPFRPRRWSRVSYRIIITLSLPSPFWRTPPFFSPGTPCMYLHRSPHTSDKLLSWKSPSLTIGNILPSLLPCPFTLRQ